MKNFLTSVIQPGTTQERAIFLCGLLGLCVLQGILGWRLAPTVNTDPHEFDQGAYVLMAQHMAESAYPWYSDGTRNPLLPWLAARFFDPQHADFLLHAKRLNVLLGVLGTLALGLFFSTRMGNLPAWNAAALAALALLLPSSTFFGAETLFYVLFFFTFVLGVWLFQRPTLLGFLAFGACAGVAALAKPSVSPLLALVLGWGVLACVAKACVRPWAPAGWSTTRFLLGALLVFAAYGALLGPRMHYAQKTYGTPFYSLPSYWFWADDWAACVEKYRDCRPQQIAAMPPEERPTLAGYFRRNSPADALSRLTGGLKVRATQFFHPEQKWRVPFDKRGRPKRVVLPHRGFYLVGLAALTGTLGLFAWRARAFPSMRAGASPICAGLERWRPVGILPFPHFLHKSEMRPMRGWVWPTLLLLSLCGLYAAATAWYLPIGPGHRFILILYLPVLWLLMEAADHLNAAAASIRSDAIYLAAHLVIFGLLTFRLATLVFDGTFEKISFTF